MFSVYVINIPYDIIYSRLAQKQDTHRFRSYERYMQYCYKPKQQYRKNKKHKKFLYLIKDPSREARNKQEKTFIRKYSRIFRKKLRHRDGHKCCMCGCTDKYLHIHHLRYTTNMDDWMSVCKDCHDLIHSG